MPIAHGLLGASIVGAVHPRPWRHYGAPLLLGAILANLPDVDLVTAVFTHSRGWHRTVTHSLVMAVVVLLMFGFALGRERWREAVAYGLAYASHGILDFATTRVGGGVALFSPFSWQRFKLNWFGLSEVPSGFPPAIVIRYLLVELLLFGSLLLLVLGVRMLLARRSGSGPAMEATDVFPE
jgi:membrane-bound metal-dependent hydrolase YbcI (DUF457 family)